MNQFPAVRIEGGLLGPDTLEQLLAGELPGQRPKDFGLDGRRSLTDEIAAVFADARAEWDVFQRRLERLPEGDPATSVTRDAWMIPLLSLLGYELRHNPRAYEVDGASFAISHRAGEAEDAPPVHIVGARQELGRLAPTGRPRLAPHSLVQEYLNRSEQLWGLVTNGLTLRLLRDTTYVRRQAYVEFDLRQIFEEQRFGDFSVLYRLLHRTRLPRATEDAQDCLLEQYYKHAVEQGGRVRERLRDDVEECIRRLADGFLSHPANQALRARVSPGYEQPDRLPAQELYRQLLRLVYRLLFLLVSEDRGLISANLIYREHYGVARLRRLLDRRSAYTEHDDIWCSLRVLWKVFSDERLAGFLGAPALNGELFEPLALDACSITNRDFLEAFWHLAYYSESSSAPPRRVNYAALDVEELGSVYESLLDYHPQIDTSGGVPRFELAFGSERKSTGSYYTPPELVAELIRSALDPVLQERLKAARTAQDKERAILSMRVLDPACGSGHFLLAAARRLGKELAKIRTGEDEPAPERVREAIRDVVGHYIYGVDKNPLAVELCRVALWLEAHCAGKPLTFLDHRIKCGDSLVGVLDLDVLKAGIPDEAFVPVSTDAKTIAGLLKKRNRSERRDLQSGQMRFPFAPTNVIADLGEKSQDIESIADDSPAAIREKKNRYDRLLADPERLRLAEACDLWTAAFYQQFLPSPSGRRAGGEGVITTEVVIDQLAGRAHPQALAAAQAIASENRFFHWPLEFPEVFAATSELHTPLANPAGFDVVLSNPPWERIKLQEEEFFAGRDPTIAHAPNAAARKRLIAELPKTNPALWEDYQRALHTAESASRFLRGSGQYPLTGRGDINTYSIFAERVRALLNPQGRAGIILPTGIATDATNQFFFAELVEKGQLLSLFDFENREALFPGVHRSYKFCLLTLSGTQEPAVEPAPLATRHSPLATFCFFATRAEHLRDPRRLFSLTAADIARINPNTRTLPVFRTRQDADLTRAIYQRVPVLVNERTGDNSWGVRFLAMFHMSNDSHLFRTRAELEAQGYRLVGNVFVEGDPHSPSAIRYSPLYEAKMLWHYDHRYGTYEGVSDRSSTQLPTPDERQHADPHFVVQPWYWVPAKEVEARLGDWQRGWLLGFRNVTNATNERSAVFGLLPKAGVGHSMPLLFAKAVKTYFVPALVANFSSIVFDYFVRQKIGGVNMTFGYIEQFPVLPPSAYTAEDLRFIVPRVLELVYTAWDLQPFAQDVWAEASDELRLALRAQWEANWAATGGHAFDLPSWAAAYPQIQPLATRYSPLASVCPFPPFRWDEARRAVLRAELDAYYARLYGLTRKQLRYILDPADLTERELEDILDPWEEVDDPLDPHGYEERCRRSTFPGETFRVLKEKEMRQFGEYRTRRLVLEAWGCLGRC